MGVKSASQKRESVQAAKDIERKLKKVMKANR